MTKLINNIDEISFTGNISGAALYYAAAFRAAEEHEFMAGIRIEPHKSGVGVIICATDGANLGLFYDKQGTVNREITIDLPNEMIKALKPTKGKDRRVTFENEIIHIEKVDSMHKLIEIFHTFPNYMQIINKHTPSYASGKHLGIMAVYNRAMKKFMFPEFTDGEFLIITECINKHYEEIKKSYHFEGLVYSIKNHAKTPFDFFGLTMPLLLESTDVQPDTPDWVE